MKLRAELAKLMGYRTFAEYSLDDTMAKTPDAVRGLLNQVWSAAVERVGEEREALTALARKEGGNYDLEAWDWRYLAEKERKARYDLDESEVRPVSPAGEHDRRGVRYGVAAVRAEVQGAEGRAALPSGCARVGGDDEGGRAGRRVPRGLLCAAVEAVGRVDVEFPGAA